jgi:adhesin transport system membrane fusion protein
MNRLDALLDRHPLPTWRRVAWPAVALLLAAIGWAGFAQLDEVAMAPGEIVPHGKIKVVQHLEGGIIEAIFVAEGDLVRTGDPLIRLNLATGGVNRNELQARLDGDLLRRARLAAEVGEGPLSFPTDAATRHPEVAEAERQAFEARRRELTSTTAVLREQTRQRELEVQELEAKRHAVSRSLALAKERLALSESLLADGLTPRLEHLQFRADVEKLEGDLQGLTAAIPRARAGVAEAEKRLHEGQVRFRRSAQDDLGQVEQSIARLRELLAEATDQDDRSEIRSPTEGIVKKLRYNTLGGVVTPGEPIMEIVPTTEDLVVHARLGPIDRGYVHAGQRAVVKVSTFDYVRYGGLEGKVVHVAPDSSTGADGIPYFEVLVETDRTYLGDAAAPLRITAGMQAMVDIHTGTKSVIEYLVNPVFKLRHEAFRER